MWGAKTSRRRPNASLAQVVESCCVFAVHTTMKTLRVEGKRMKKIKLRFKRKQVHVVRASTASSINHARKTNCVLRTPLPAGWKSPFSISLNCQNIHLSRGKPENNGLFLLTLAILVY